MHLVFSLSKFSPLVDIVFRWEGGRLRRGRRGRGREKETANKDKAGSVQCPVHHFPSNPTPSPLQCRLLLLTHVPVGKICENVEKNVPSLPTKNKIFEKSSFLEETTVLFDLLYNGCPRLTPISLSGPLGTTLGSIDQQKKDFEIGGNNKLQFSRIVFYSISYSSKTNAVSWVF